jgi:hypothetical protein
MKRGNQRPLGLKLRVDEEDMCHKFANARDPLLYDQLLSDGSISNPGVKGGAWTALHSIPFKCQGNEELKVVLLSFLLTFEPSKDFFSTKICKAMITAMQNLHKAAISTTGKPTDSLKTIPDCGYSEFLANFRINDGSTPIHHAAINDDITSLRILIDFDGDRKLLKPHQNGLSVTAERIGAANAVKMLREYYPTKEQMMKTQLECKLRADAMFHTSRYRQTEIDLKFRPIWEILYPGLYDAIESGQVDHVDRFLPLSLVSEWPRSPMLLFIISTCLKKCSHPAALVHFFVKSFADLLH